jgi:3-deoxy-D-manno-octulosonic-acid transferase
LFPGAIRYSEWSANGFPPLQTGPSRVLIIDSIGLLSRLYRYAHITYVGGGFNRGGIHNILEPAVYGKPVLFGPVYQKFSEAVEMAARGSGIPIHDEATLKKSLERLWENPSLLKEKSEDAGAYVKEHGGATQAIIDYIAANRLLTN